METIIALAMTLLAVAFVGYPLLRSSKPDEEVPDEEESLELDMMVARKETALNAIRELEFDYTVGNLSDEDYDELKEKYERRAISILKSLDELQAEDEGDYSTEKRDLAPMVASPQRGEQETEGRVCACCGKTYGPEHRFCTSCGADLDLSSGNAGTKAKTTAGTNQPKVAGKAAAEGKREVAPHGPRNRRAGGQKSLSGIDRNAS